MKKILQSGVAGGILLLLCVIIALALANSPYGFAYNSFLTNNLGFQNEFVQLRYTVLQWINDGLMAVFFLLVGLEIKREIVKGELSTPQKAALPVLAAVGGAVTPAFIFWLLNKDENTSAGWGIPMATDIAFALAIITMLGKRVPPSLKIFLAALAIADDLMAILVIAFFYTSELHHQYLVYGGAIVVLLIIFNRAGFTNLILYLVPGLFIWYFIHHSGIHATVAGVIVAMTIPTKTSSGLSPLEKLEHTLQLPVSFIIMPMFALANTNVRFEPEMLHGLITPLGLGILLGLVVGKPLGIALISRVALKSGLSVLPKGVSPAHIIGAGMLGGIGFTMSIFISVLSFTESELLQSEAKFSILVASVISALAGTFFLLSLPEKSSKK